MKVLVRAALAASCVLVVGCSHGSSPASVSKGSNAAPALAQVGALAPDFTVSSLDGRKISLDRFRGKPVFINMFATWCPPCKQELPDIVSSYAQYKDKVVYLGLDEQEEVDPVIPFVKQFHIAYQVGLDPGKVAEKYEVGSIPESVFIDKQGVVRKIWRGFLPAAELHDNLTAIVND